MAIAMTLAEVLSGQASVSDWLTATIALLFIGGISFLVWDYARMLRLHSKMVSPR